MTRKKVKLAWIGNNTSRRVSLKKRRLGLVKKVMELTTLCGIEACLVIYSPDEQEPVVWPSQEEARRLIKKFYQVPEIERIKKMMNLETYIKEKVFMLQDQLKKMNRKNMKVEVRQLMLQIEQGKMVDEFNVNELDCLIWYMETMRIATRKHTEYYQPVPFSSAASIQGVDPLPPPAQGPTIGDQIGNANAMIRSGASSKISRFHVEGIPGLPYSSAGDSSLAPHLWVLEPSYGASSSVVAEQGMPRPPFGVGSSSNVVANGLGLPRPPFGKGNSSNVAAYGLGLPSPLAGEGSSSNVVYHLGLPMPSFGEGSSLNVASDHLGLPRLPFGEGRSSNIVVDHLGLPRPPFGEGSSSNVAVDHLGLQRPPFGGSSSSSSFDILKNLNIVIDLTDDNNLGTFGGQDVGLGHYPASEFGRNHFKFFNGESSSSGNTSNSEMEGTN
ncbi:hypothetical protein Godav_023640 [Gossypium davidsonii]|uniref:MADS-box domain-containing protein n=2 Tax=Gossypium TaxID=3633 RepID=A0A7J8VPL5_9ROSI|nr:hypothetical protein [Gossypium davidsonii]MBA0664697.1 hypothetical protein [Gossypium klotzschianum]MBA0664698.1 hypothetical protein [Gossypium klotzschianum]MBA0664699.1 hypothetical protein [Gossypium klotzschianum]